jgi:hypothetical protein
VNWVAASLQLGHTDEASQLVELAQRLEATIPKMVSAESEFQDAAALLMAHRAKLMLLSAADGPEELDRTDPVHRASELYRRVVAHFAQEDHRRTNSQIEWGEQLLRFEYRTGHSTMKLVGDVLEEAQQSLNTHPCDRCRGYYFDTAAHVSMLKGNKWYPYNLTRAASNWTEARRAASLSLEQYQKRQDPWASFPRAIHERLTRRLETAMRPRKVFLSHAGADKPMVRRFKLALDDLGFDPWLDEDAMAAGANLERALLQGFKDSCAAVFFVTPAFKDQRFVGSEIDYAVAEKRARGASFAIVTLMFASGDGKFGEVPDLLRPYVWKNPANELEALRELIRALPLKPAVPAWKDEEPVSPDYD